MKRCTKPASKVLSVTPYVGVSTDIVYTELNGNAAARFESRSGIEPTSETVGRYSVRLDCEARI